MPTQFQYVVVKYVPDVVRDESVNVGVIVRSLAGDGFDFRVSPRTTRLRALSANADRSLVRNFESQLLRAKQGEPMGMRGVSAEDHFFGKARAEFNGNLQLTNPRGLLSESLPHALDHLFTTFVKDEAQAPLTLEVAPAAARRRLVSQFRRRHLIGLDRVVPNFVVAGRHAKWEFDLGYQNGHMHVFRSIALSASSEEKNLSRALLYKGMCDEVRAEHTNMDSVAVIDLPTQTEGARGVVEAKAILVDAGIRVVASGQMDLLLSQVAADLETGRAA